VREVALYDVPAFPSMMCMVLFIRTCIWRYR